MVAYSHSACFLLFPKVVKSASSSVKAYSIRINLTAAPCGTRCGKFDQVRPGSKVLDVGCGVGGPMRNISVFGDCEVQGITINQYQASFNPHCFNNPCKANDVFQKNMNARSLQRSYAATDMLGWGIGSIQARGSMYFVLMYVLCLFR